MHDAHRAATLRHNIDHSLVRQRRDIIHHVGTGLQSRQSDTRFASVDGDAYIRDGASDRLDDRNYSANLLGVVDRGGSRTGRLTSDVDPLGTIADHV